MPTPIITMAQMRTWEEATWSARRTPAEVISRVGHIVAAYARRYTRPGDVVIILAGKGHNGDDARQAVVNLADREVTLLNVTSPDLAWRELSALLTLPPCLLIDALFGTGLRGPLEAPWKKLINRINKTGVPILSVDVPSGLNADTGHPEGAAIQATRTLTLAAPKIGLIASHAAPFVGKLVLAPDIGLVPCPHSSDLLWTSPGDFERYPGRRPVEGHKGTFGHLALFAGSLGYHGAAVLATRAALRTQPGLVSLIVPEDIYIPVASQLQSAMVHPWTSSTQLPENTTAILAGPGQANRSLPTDLIRFVQKLWQESPLPMMVDASALAWLPTGKEGAKACRVLTPHPGEAAGLLGISIAEVQANRTETLRALSNRFGECWVVLKGHQTLVGRATGPLYVNSSGNPTLAQGGSGDVLAGLAAGWLAQPINAADPLLALRYAVWQHGAAADALSRRQSFWMLEDLLAKLEDRMETGEDLPFATS